jgi:hypothetical protein
MYQSHEKENNPHLRTSKQTGFHARPQKNHLLKENKASGKRSGISDGRQYGTRDSLPTIEYVLARANPLSSFPLNTSSRPFLLNTFSIAESPPGFTHSDTHAMTSDHPQVAVLRLAFVLIRGAG